jgi:hypothetical protein
MVSAGGRRWRNGVKRPDSQERDTLTACSAVEKLGRPHQRREGLAGRIARAGAKLYGFWSVAGAPREDVVGRKMMAPQVPAGPCESSGC